MLFDFHTHTTLSDGECSPCDLIRHSMANGYSGIALTDHTGPGAMERIITELSADCLLVRERWNFPAMPGVELTHIPASSISELAAQARQLGAALVIVHGETLVEPVEPGTNLAAVTSPHVDVLAHPGHLTEEEAKLAAEMGVFIEISARAGHNIGNGQVARMAERWGAKLIVDSDSHAPKDLLTEQKAHKVARGSGVENSGLDQILRRNPLDLLERMKARLPEDRRYV